MKKVILYTTPTCVFCPLVKKFLEEKGAEYEEIDVSEDEKARQEMIEKSGQMSVPVVTIGDDAIIGFNKKKLEESLNKNS